MKTKNKAPKVVTKPTGNKKPNKPVTVFKKPSVKYSGPASTPPKGAVPSKTKKK
jgi:hypothetical protein